MDDVQEEAVTPLPRLAYSIEEAAAVLSIGRTLVYNLTKAGQLRAKKIGARTVILHTELERFLDEAPFLREPPDV